MKKLLYTWGISLLLVSCGDDYLNTEPQSSTSASTVFTTLEYAESALNGICRLMGKQYLSTQGMNGEGTIKTWYGNYPGNDFQKSNLTGWSSLINSSYHERPSSIYLYYPWYYYYRIIGNANAIIVNMDNIKTEDKGLLFVKAQAYTFRAYAYSMLVQLYCYRWADSNGGASRGLPLRIDTSSDALPASTLLQVYEQIYADLDEAISLYTQSGKDRPSNDNYSPNLNVAHAVYARAALNREDWQTAATHAAQARKGYPIMSNAEYMGGFNEPNQEWIWSVYGSTDQQLHYYSYHAYQASNSSASVCRNYPCAISKELIDQVPESDIRRGLYLIPEEEEKTEIKNTGEASGNLLARGKKEFGEWLYSTSKVFAYMQFKIRLADGDHQPGVGHVNNFRSAEMYYIEAEADCHLNKEEEARQILLTLNRDSGRNPEYTCTKSGADLLAEVKLYRRFDLWGEGFDYFDYKRWNEPIVRHSYAQGGSFHTTFSVTVQPSDGNKWTWLYPDREINYNDALDAN